MNGRTNSNGILFSKVAIIKVIAESGSTVSFINNGRAMKVLDSSYAFVVPDANESTYYYDVGPSKFGIWTVTAELNGKTISKTIEITDPDIYTVDLHYIYLYRDGVLNEDLTGGMKVTNRRQTSSTASGKNPTITWGDSYMTWYLNNGGGTLQTIGKINVTDYNILDVYAVYTATKDAVIRCFISTASTGYWDDTWVAVIPLGVSYGTTVLDHYSVDISAVAGSYYFVIAGSRGSTVNSADFYEISLRK